VGGGQFKKINRFFKWDKLMKKKIVIFSIVLLLLIIGTSLAFFNSNLLGIKESNLTSPNITFTYKEKSNAFTLNKEVSDEEGKISTSYFEFDVTGLSSIQEEISYVIYLSKQSGNLDEKYIKVYLTKLINGKEEAVVEPISLGDLKNYLLAENSKKLYNNQLSLNANVEKTDTYRLRAWISKDELKETEFDKTTSGNTTNVTIDSMSYSFTVNVSTKDQTDLEGNYCLDHGITNLSNCMLQAETKKESIDDAMTTIQAKGTPDFSKIAPEVLYIETTSEVSSTQANGIIYGDNYIVLAPSYSFDKTTGIFSLKNSISNEEVSDQHIGYYTCWNTTSSCTTMYQLKEYEIKTTSTGKRYILRKATKHSYNVVEKLDNNNGLYATEDDDGMSYYYRGNVKNNYVSYAGFIWRIVRRNGDGSVRMIYQGKSVTDKANPIATEYNTSYWDPTFVGYKYTKDFERKEGSVDTGYTNFNENTKYYFGTSYTYDAATERFKLSGEVKSGTWEVMHLDAQNKYYYTCFGTGETATCPVLFQITGYVNSKQAKLRFISYSSKSYDRAVENTTDSNAKQKLDTWYETNILNKKDLNNKSYADYVSDEIFCNDRSIISGSGDGFNLAPTTYYGSYTRLASKKTPSLKCPQPNDQFTTGTTKGNGDLKYPVALITADEVALAGGIKDKINEKYYLNFGVYYFTMSPIYFYSYSGYADMWRVNPTGDMNASYVASYRGMRPVLNLKFDIQIISGNGTISSPYQVILN